MKIFQTESKVIYFFDTGILSINLLRKKPKTYKCIIVFKQTLATQRIIVLGRLKGNKEAQ